jgi:hypothetical protein
MNRKRLAVVLFAYFFVTLTPNGDILVHHFNTLAGCNNGKAAAQSLGRIAVGCYAD